MIFSSMLARTYVLACLLCLILGGCRPSGPPSIQFTQVPLAGPGGPIRLVTISGIARGVRSNQHIVLFSKADNWWVQPYTERPFTSIARDGTWSTSIHMGSDYAALLVDEGYHPAPRMDILPAVGGEVEAVAILPGRPNPDIPPPPPPTFLSFSGYEWTVFGWSNERLGSHHEYSAKNVSLDGNGYLHLRIIGSPKNWTCSQLGLTRSLGYGTYEFTVENSSKLEPAAVLSMYTWAEQPEQNHREMNINLTHWGDPANKGAEFVVQPYFLAKNVYRFNETPGTATYSFRWEPDGVTFQALPGRSESRQRSPIASHSFNVGVPSPGHENIFMNFCEFSYSDFALKHDAETVIERFQYLP